MRTKCAVSAIGILLGASLLSSARAESPSDPTVRKVEAVVEAIRGYGQAEGANATKLDGLIDLDGLAQRALGAHWAKLSAAERKTFRKLLRDLFHEVAYPNAAEFFGDLALQVNGVQEDDTLLVLGPPGMQVVNTEVSHPEEGLVEIDFALAKVGGEWKVVDVVLDGVSLGLDIRSQMQEILAEDGYAELKRRMREKIEEEGSEE